MTYHDSNIANFWGYLIVEELIRTGANYFCISPGSRSTPLTVAAAQNDKAQCIVCYDERGAAFHALGYAKATGKPPVLICTSGTAAANYFPAIIEAAQTNQPLIVLTADRPPELRDTGANQTIDQVKIYGNYMRWFFDLPAPDENINPRFVLTTVDQLAATAKHPLAGPVHLNCMFREPLEPKPQQIPQAYIKQIQNWQKRTSPYTRKVEAVSVPSKNIISDLADKMNQAQQGILAVGRLDSYKERRVAGELIRKLNWPVFADISSGLRSSATFKNVITFFDQLLLHEKTGSLINPDLMVHLGAPLTSKRFLQFCQKFHPDQYVHISKNNSRNDPQHQVSVHIAGNIEETAQQLIPLLRAGNHEQVKLVSSYDNILRKLITEEAQPAARITEISLAVHISQYLPENHALFLGNSMPIRDFDMFADFTKAPVHIGTNRGASGIDGTLATASGFANGHDKSLTVVLGDLALMHDLNSLHLINQLPHPLILIVVNNQGGGIFSFLPIAEYDLVFEPFFATPHDLNFSASARQFGLEYATPETNQDLVAAYNKALQSKTSCLIEVRTDRHENVALHKALQNKIIENL